MSTDSPTDDFIPAEIFVTTIAVNVDNPKLDDAEFREFIRVTLPIVAYERLES